MPSSSSQSQSPATLSADQDYDRLKEVKHFDDSKIGAKGILDSGLTSIPRFFHHPPRPTVNGPVPKPSSPSSTSPPRATSPSTKSDAPQSPSGSSKSPTTASPPQSTSSNQRPPTGATRSRCGPRPTLLFPTTSPRPSDRNCSSGTRWCVGSGRICLGCCRRVWGPTRKVGGNGVFRIKDNEVGRLQVKYGEEWVDVEAVPDALVINIGEILQGKSGGPRPPLAIKLLRPLFAHCGPVVLFDFGIRDGGLELSAVGSGNMWSPHTCAANFVAHEMATWAFRVGFEDHSMVMTHKLPQIVSQVI
ncbi:hypothetical protein Acr_25g0002350 [Actinidia rufa]|uniref:Uncharacterized protein n=1 Tax=Actinidia rufa TaxID=165716 RepID=A0A7J0GYE7_9ERIC|nr:hypothetical protein Acr_25g0002350 [Actinidia rufa]